MKVRGDGNCLFSSVKQLLTTPDNSGPEVKEQRRIVSEKWTDEFHELQVLVSSGEENETSAE